MPTTSMRSSNSTSPIASNLASGLSRSQPNASRSDHPQVIAYEAQRSRNDPTASTIRCGWSDLDVFGCDRDRPDARFDAMGLVLLLDRMEVVGIDPEGADLVTETGTRQRYRRRPLPANTVSLWALGRDD